jgi:hypothetical protein
VRSQSLPGKWNSNAPPVALNRGYPGPSGITGSGLVKPSSHRNPGPHPGNGRQADSRSG